MPKRNHFRTDRPTCPHCDYALNDDEMIEHRSEEDTDMYTLAHGEDRDSIECPQCDQIYWLQGLWTPVYTSALAEDDL